MCAKGPTAYKGPEQGSPVGKATAVRQPALAVGPIRAACVVIAVYFPQETVVGGALRAASGPEHRVLVYKVQVKSARGFLWERTHEFGSSGGFEQPGLSCR